MTDDKLKKWLKKKRESPLDKIARLNKKWEEEGIEFKEKTYEKKPNKLDGHKGYKKLTQEEVLIRFEDRHKGRYNYSQMKYKNKRTEVIIICVEHGPFYILPHTHMRGTGCKKCKLKKR